MTVEEFYRQVSELANQVHVEGAHRLEIDIHLVYAKGPKDKFITVDRRLEFKVI